VKLEQKKRALFSLHKSDSSIGFACRLIECGWTIIATNNVAKILKENDIEVQDVADFLNIKETFPFPPTLHPKMELSLTTNEAESIHMVFDTTYPLSDGNDVGGHTLLALAAKGSRIVVSNQDDMEKVLDQIQAEGKLTPEFHETLIRKAYKKISSHYSYLYEAPSTTQIDLQKRSRKISLKEGENPYQVPANLIVEDCNDTLSLGNFEQVSGESPCFTNVADWDSILKILCSLSEVFRKNFNRVPNILIAAKHGNPCGLGVDWDSPQKALELALFGNPKSVWGGEVITNFHIDPAIGQILLASELRKEILGNPNWMLDLIVAPNISKESIEILGKRKERKLYSNPSLKEANMDKTEWSSRPVRGGKLEQPPNNYILDLSDRKVLTSSNENKIKESLAIAWAVAFHSNHGGNEVAIAKEGQLLGVGGGPSTIEAVEIAVHRAQSCRHNLQGSVFVADAFFPFTDAPEILIQSGCKYGLIPKGGKNFNLVQKLFIDRNVEVCYLPSSIRGFCRH
jgi:phosphoribosylaminoimidazolecarboxamide formyltransferase / IMP cyclohydrolase